MCEKPHTTHPPTHPPTHPLTHPPLQEALLTGLALCFATIPEELPLLIAAVLAVGALTLSHKNIYVKSLKAQESLAYVDTILTDKTGRYLFHPPTPRST